MRPLLQIKKFRHLSTIGFTAICLSLSACDSAMIAGLNDGTDGTDGTDMLTPDPGNNIFSVLESDENFETLVAAINAAGLTEVLSSTNTNTLFAPNDAAFDALGTEAVNALIADPDTLQNILLYHVLPGRNDAAAATGLAGTSVATANQSTVAISLDGESLLVNDATVIRADIEASNGIIHEIDKVLTPPATNEGGGNEDAGDMFAVLQADGDFNTLTAALEATNLNTVLANTDETYTLFAPTDAAFNELGSETVNALLADTDRLTNILLYHVISGAPAVDSGTAISLAGTSVPSASNDSTLAISLNGAELMINDSTVTRADISTSNGLVHEIDKVLLPPTDATPTEVDVVATLASKPDYSQLVSLVQSAGLADTLADSASTFTVFAPTNAAFEALDDALLAGLAGDQAALSALLRGHVITGSVDSAAATALAGQNATTLSGADWPVNVTDGVLSIGGANVIDADIAASNGIIHGIDAVLQ